MHKIEIAAVDRWSSNFTLHQSDLEHLSQHPVLALTGKAPDLAGLSACIPNKLALTLVLPASGPCFENRLLKIAGWIKIILLVLGRSVLWLWVSLLSHLSEFSSNCPSFFWWWHYLYEELKHICTLGNVWGERILLCWPHRLLKCFCILPFEHMNYIFFQPLKQPPNPWTDCIWWFGVQKIRSLQIWG